MSDDILSTPCVYEPRSDGDVRPFIYGLIDPLEPKHVRYVGMAFKTKRPYQHAIKARNNSNHSYLFHWIRSLQSEGRNPSVLLLEELSIGATRKFVGEIEKMYISSLREIGHRLINVAKGGDGGDVGNYAHSEESRRNAANALRKYYKDPENQVIIAERNASQSNTKIQQYAEDPERVQKLSHAMKGKQLRLGAILSPEIKDSLSKGMIRYYENPKNQIAIAERNVRRAHTKASRPKVVMSEESNQARSKSLTGRTFSEAHRAAISASAKERARKKREDNDGN